MNKATKIAMEISGILPEEYKEKILEKAQSPNDIDHDENFWNTYKEACNEAYEKVTGKEFDEKGMDLLEKAEDIVFEKRFGSKMHF